MTRLGSVMRFFSIFVISDLLTMCVGSFEMKKNMLLDLYM